MNCRWNCYTVEFIYTIVPQTYTICGRIYMQINYLPAGGAIGAGELEVSPVTLYTNRAPLTNAALSDINARWNENDIQNFLKTAGFDFETCSAQPSVPPPPQPLEFL